jgi:hypothetical protein
MHGEPHPNPLLSLSHDQRSTPLRLTIRDRKWLKRFCYKVYSPGRLLRTQPNRQTRASSRRQAPIQQHPRIENVHIYSNKWLLSSYPSTEASISLSHRPTGSHQGRRRSFAYSPRTGASSSTAADLVAPVLLVPLLPSGAAAASCSFSSRRVGEWTPHRSDCSTARPTAPAPAHPIQQRLSSTGSVLSPSSMAAAVSWASPMNS